MKYDFDKIIDRTNTNCYKWDFNKQMFGTENVIPLWVADMDFSSPEPVVKKLVERAKHGIYGYSLEPEEFYQSFQNWLEKRLDWKIKKGWITNAVGIVPAINFAIQCFTKPGAKILVQTPVYFPFFESIQNNGRVVVNSQLKLVGNRYEMDFTDLAAKLKNGVKMMLLCSPHNPVGRVWTKTELQKVAELCVENNVLLISDEIHADLVLKGSKHIPMGTINSEIRNNMIAMYAPSKTFNVAGLATSSIVIPNQEIREKFQDYLKKLGLHLLNLFGIEAYTAVYTGGEDWLEQLLEYLETNYRFVQDYLARSIPSIKVIELEGTYLMWLDCRELNLSQKELVDLFVNKAGLGMNDGAVFGAGGEGFMRLNIGCSRFILEKALRQMKKAIDDLTPTLS
ncbi:MAG: PatB family C-S lyase [Candidatus Cloacimonadales bacterium]|nr:PatB family C-S lyase [Candidatus Cloacimonadales bacterium]